MDIKTIKRFNKIFKLSMKVNHETNNTVVIMTTMKGTGLIVWIYLDGCGSENEDRSPDGKFTILPESKERYKMMDNLEEDLKLILKVGRKARRKRVAK